VKSWGSPDLQEPAPINREANSEENREDVEVSKRHLGELIEVRRVLAGYVANFARELRDEAPAPASTTRLLNLDVKSGLALDDFVARTMGARLTAQRRTGAITKPATRGRGRLGTRTRCPSSSASSKT
jgi:hypothetical protein